MKVCVFGLGYVGCVTAACLARDGHKVVGVDVEPAKIDPINGGHSPVREPGLEELMAEVVGSGRLRATSDVGDGLERAEISLICVGTPSRRDGSLELSHVKQVAGQIGSNLGAAAAGHVVVVRSTVLPGSARQVVLPELEHAAGGRAGEGFDLCVNPEFLREGSSLADYDQPSRVLVGEREPGVGDRVAELYARVEAPLFRTSLEVAEAVKYADNAFHALKCTFANEIGRIYRAHGVDAGEVMEIVIQDRKLNISPLYLRPGFSFGGSCLPKDLRALTFAARQAGARVPMLDEILNSNTIPVLEALEEILATGRRRVALLGLAFKRDTDDLRESPFLELAERLIGKGIELAIYDSQVNLAFLHGSNRAYLEQKLPHIGRLLMDDLEAVVDGAEVVVVSHEDPLFARDDEWRAQGKVVLRLA